MVFGLELILRALAKTLSLPPFSSETIERIFFSGCTVIENHVSQGSVTPESGI